MGNESEILFCETQRFSKWILAIIGGIAATILVMQAIVIRENGIDENSEFWVKALPVLILIPSLYFFVCVMKLRTKVSDKIYVRLFPFKVKEIEFDQIDKCYARKYRPIMEYGGWGVKGSFSNGKAYSSRGNEGVQLVLKSGKKILIGSQKNEELAGIINKSMGNLSY